MVKNKYVLMVFVGLVLSFSSCGKEFMPIYEKATQAYNNKQYVVTIDLIQAALPHWSKDDGNEIRAKAYEMLGISYEKLNKRDKALEAYNTAINLSKNTYQSAINLGYIYIGMGNAKSAVKSFKKALVMKKDDPHALLGLGNAHYELKKYRLAKKNYIRIIHTSPAVKTALEQIKVVDKKLRKTKKKRKVIRRYK